MNKIEKLEKTLRSIYNENEGALKSIASKSCLMQWDYEMIERRIKRFEKFIDDLIKADVKINKQLYNRVEQLNDQLCDVWNKRS